MSDINNFIIDHVSRGIMKSLATDEIQWSLTQIEEPHIKCTSETKEVIDAVGSTIASIERAKKAEFTGSNSLWDLGLYAAQMGADKELASSTAKIASPMFEIIPVTKGLTEVTLKHVPIGVTGAEIKHIYMLNGDSTLGVPYKLGTAANATDFILAAATKKITLPTGLSDGNIFVEYTYEAEKGVSIVNTSDKFPKAGKFIMEVLGHEPCALGTKIGAYLICNNAKLVSEVDLSFMTEGKHSFTIKCNQDYCSPNKDLFHIVIPQD